MEFHLAAIVTNAVLIFGGLFKKRVESGAPVKVDISIFFIEKAAQQVMAVPQGSW